MLCSIAITITLYDNAWTTRYFPSSPWIMEDNRTLALVQLIVDLKIKVQQCRHYIVILGYLGRDQRTLKGDLIHLSNR